MIARVLVPLLIAFAVAGCAEPTATAPNAGPPSATNVSTPGVLSTPSVGPSTLDCGTFVPKATEQLPDSMVRCFIDAVAAGRPVILRETKTTIEGDPIPIVYVASADGQTVVTTDTRQDAYGPKAITRQTCTGPKPWQAGLTFAQCTELPG